jgi:hypothetical protein
VEMSWLAAFLTIEICGVGGSFEIAR